MSGQKGLTSFFKPAAAAAAKRAASPVRGSSPKRAKALSTNSAGPTEADHKAAVVDLCASSDDDVPIAQKISDTIAANANTGGGAGPATPGTDYAAQAAQAAQAGSPTLKSLLCEPGWRKALSAVLESKEFAALDKFVAEERKRHEVFPPAASVFNAFHACALKKTRVVVLGQDPYHDNGQAMGLSFSVHKNCKIPPSLRNMYKELQSDTGIVPPNHGDLSKWADQGVLLLNAVLTVQAHKADSHKGKGWEAVTDAAVKAVSRECEGVVFLLWGAKAQKKKGLVDATKHTVLECPHPSPLSARHGWYGSKHFSKTNAALARYGKDPIDWAL